MKDQDAMPFGKHKEKAMANVPDKYLMWLYGQLMIKVESGCNLTDDEAIVLAYIEDFGVENLTED